MTMFDELFALACSATLTMTVSADEKSGRLTINVIPRPRLEAGEPALAQPLSLTATPQEFDAGFVEALRSFREVRLSLAQQAEATKEVIEAAKLASVRKATEATTKAAATKPTPAKPAPAGPAASPAGEAADDTQDGSAETSAVGGVSGGSEPYDLFG